MPPTSQHGDKWPTTADIVVVQTVEADRIPQLMQLYAATWWADTRTAEEVTRLLGGSDIVLGLVHRPDDRLVGFARVLTDNTYLALILDVVVAPDMRQAGLGARLMDELVSHPALSDVRSLELVCQPELVAFYRRWGFTDQVGGSRLMRRTTDPLLGGLYPAAEPPPIG